MVLPWTTFASNRPTLAALAVCAGILSGCAGAGAITGKLVLPGARPSSALEGAESNPAEAIAYGGACDAVISVRAVEVKSKRKPHAKSRAKLEAESGSESRSDSRPASGSAPEALPSCESLH